jgi:hypothetical protein
MNPVSITPPNHQQLYEIAEQQAGYFTAAQAQAVGFSRPLLSYYTKAGRFSRREVLIEHQLIVDDRNTFGDQICAILSGPISMMNFFSLVPTGEHRHHRHRQWCQYSHRLPAGPFTPWRPCELLARPRIS